MNTQQYNVTSALIWNCFMRYNVSVFSKHVLFKSYLTFGLAAITLFFFFLLFVPFFMCLYECYVKLKNLIENYIYALSTKNHVYLKGFPFNLKPEFDWCAKKGQCATMPLLINSICTL